METEKIPRFVFFYLSSGGIYALMSFIEIHPEYGFDRSQFDEGKIVGVPRTFGYTSRHEVIKNTLKTDREGTLALLVLIKPAIQMI